MGSNETTFESNVTSTFDLPKKAWSKLLFKDKARDEMASRGERSLWLAKEYSYEGNVLCDEKQLGEELGQPESRAICS